MGVRKFYIFAFIAALLITLYGCSSLNPAETTDSFTEASQTSEPTTSTAPKATDGPEASSQPQTDATDSPVATSESAAESTATEPRQTETEPTETTAAPDISSNPFDAETVRLSEYDSDNYMLTTNRGRIVFAKSDGGKIPLFVSAAQQAAADITSGNYSNYTFSEVRIDDIIEINGETGIVLSVYFNSGSGEQAQTRVFSFGRDSLIKSPDAQTDERLSLIFSDYPSGNAAIASAVKASLLKAAGTDGEDFDAYAQSIADSWFTLDRIYFDCGVMLVGTVSLSPDKTDNTIFKAFIDGADIYKYISYSETVYEEMTVFYPSDTAKKTFPRMKAAISDAVSALKAENTDAVIDYIYVLYTESATLYSGSVLEIYYNLDGEALSELYTVGYDVNLDRLYVNPYLEKEITAVIAGDSVPGRDYIFKRLMTGIKAQFDDMGIYFSESDAFASLSLDFSRVVYYQDKFIYAGVINGRVYFVAVDNMEFYEAVNDYCAVFDDYNIYYSSEIDETLFLTMKRAADRAINRIKRNIDPDAVFEKVRCEYAINVNSYTGFVITVDYLSGAELFHKCYGFAYDNSGKISAKSTNMDFELSLCEAGRAPLGTAYIKSAITEAVKEASRRCFKQVSDDEIKREAENPNYDNILFLGSVVMFTGEVKTEFGYVAYTAVIDCDEFLSLFKYVAFTFDDGPSPSSGCTDSIISTLKKYNSLATFFMVGQYVSELSSDLMRQIAEAGCEIGCHSYSHEDFKTLTDEQILREIKKSTKLVYDYTGYTIQLLRPPYGSYTEEMFEKLNESLPIPMKLVLWSLDSNDWVYNLDYVKGTYSFTETAEMISNYVLSKIYNGATVLMHDSHATSAAAFALLCPQLVSRGYVLLTVSELAQIKAD